MEKIEETKKPAAPAEPLEVEDRDEDETDALKDEALLSRLDAEYWEDYGELDDGGFGSWDLTRW